MTRAPPNLGAFLAGASLAQSPPGPDVRVIVARHSRIAGLLIAGSLLVLAGCDKNADDRIPAAGDNGAAAVTAQQPSAEELHRRSIERRAVEAAIWGMAAVNTDLMRQEMFHGLLRHEGCRPDGARDSARRCPRLVEWQHRHALADVARGCGLLGIDKGKGGKFVIVPPGFEGKLPAGMSPLRSDTFTGYGLLRVAMKSHGDADVAKSIAYGKTIKFYPLSAVSDPPATVFTDVKDVDFDSTIRYDASFYESLHRVVQEDVWIERDRAMIDPLRTLGIEKGKPYAPDAETQKILTSAIAEARGLLESRYDAGFPVFFTGTHWTMPGIPESIEGQGTNYADHDKYAIDGRGVAYTYAYISIKRLGAGQFYLISISDKDGNFYDGAKTYRLNVPANVPVEQYWSVTVYDKQTHALVKGMSRASRSSQIPEMQKSADDSVDIYFGPKAPEGKEPNWVPTDPKRGFELMLRLYGPTKAFFDKKSWVLGDPEVVS